MSVSKPSLRSYYEALKTDLGPFDLRFSSKKILAHAVAGTAHMLTTYAENLARLNIPDSQDEDILMRWCHVYGLTRIPAKCGEIEIEIETSEPVHLSGKTSWSGKNGEIYHLEKPLEVHGVSRILLQSETPGSFANCQPDDVLTITATIAGLKSSARVTQQTIEGFDTETLQHLRRRLREHLRRPAHGGCAYDYINWALEHPGSENAWVLPRPGRRNGHVSVIYSKAEGQASDAEREELERFIGERCPISAIVHVDKAEVCLLDVELELEIRGTIAIEELEQAIQAELAYMIQKLAAPRGYLDKDLKTERGTIHISDIAEALSLIKEIKYYKIISPREHFEPSVQGQIVGLGKLTVQERKS